MNKNEIFDMIKNLIVDYNPDVEIQNIKITDSLKEFGLNSIERMDLLVDLMENLKIKMPMVAFGNLKNIEGIVDIITLKMNEGL